MRISDWSSDVCSSDLLHIFLDILDFAVGCARGHAVQSLERLIIAGFDEAELEGAGARLRILSECGREVGEDVGVAVQPGIHPLKLDDRSQGQIGETIFRKGYKALLHDRGAPFSSWSAYHALISHDRSYSIVNDSN